MSFLKKEQQQDSTVKTLTIRMNLLFFLLFLMLSALVVRLSFIQLTKGESYRTLAAESHLDQMPIPAPRGFIYDRNKTLLVSDTPSFTLMYSGTFHKTDPKFQTLVNKIHQLIPQISTTEIEKRMTANPWVSVSHRIATGLTDQQVSFIREHQDQFPGCNIIIEPVRKYIYGDLAGHVIGYLNSIPASQVGNYKKLGYQVDDKVGLAGVEMQYESYLH
ncbi:hypothetical protein LSG31_08905 [Fodinisporobacter ferrooxydans]|uniref:beta-lactamase n=1 Tax=Fodinisporobacter ferrooxydans TaxID=2901836 RepID=A0ABY4CP42_9BACL|nr:hypothetical protein LSG31_08905 [Alicyclobacillaceae bacterium MYW30-H2]